MTDITVSTVDFRNAVLATRPHLPDPKADHLTDLCRVHCRIARYGLIVAATNTVTAALAMGSTPRRSRLGASASRAARFGSRARRTGTTPAAWS